MTTTLFDAAQAVRMELATVDLDTGELSEGYAASRELFERKGAACVAYAIDEAAQIEAAEAMLKAMAVQVAARKARLGKFVDGYLAGCMKATGISKLSCDGLATATLYIDRDESVELDNGAVFDAALCMDPKPPTPSKSKIKAAILAGQPIAGARIVRKDRLTIK